MLECLGSKLIRTAYRSPWQSGVAERWVGSCHRELLDHVIVLSESHVRRLVLANYVLGDCRLGHIDSEFEQFTVEARCSPERICHTHLSDEVSDFLRHFGPSRLAPSTLPRPIQTESLPMPGDHRLRFDNDQR